AEITEAVPVRPRMWETFFISYSHTDVAAARQLFAGLQRYMDADVAWFDKSELKPGDDWEQKIRNAINGCYLFLPLISTNTETRDEGFFREEWMLASKRDISINGDDFLISVRKFIIPVVIDRDYDGNASRFQRVPKRFLTAHFGYAPEGNLSDELRKELIEL